MAPKREPDQPDPDAVPEKPQKKPRTIANFFKTVPTPST